MVSWAFMNGNYLKQTKFQGIVTKLRNKSIWGAGKQDSTGGLFGFDCISKILEVHSYKATHLIMFSGKRTMYT